MTNSVSTTIREWSINIICGVLAVVCAASFVGTLVYFSLFYGSISEHKAENAIKQAVENYLAKPNRDNAKIIISQFKKCDELVHDRTCKSIVNENKKLIEQAIQHIHMDLFLNEEVFPIDYFSYGTADIWTKYTGKHWAGNLKKAEAFSKDANYKEALPLYKSLFQDHKERYVAVRMQRILTYYGCTDDIAIWSEFAPPDYDYVIPEVTPRGTPFPKAASAITTDEIADRRIKLRKGEFVEFTENCPVRKLLN